MLVTRELSPRTPAKGKGQRHVVGHPILGRLHRDYQGASWAPLIRAGAHVDGKGSQHGLTNLALGDFATALRREQIMGDKFDPNAVVEALEAECSVKPQATQRGIGFTATL